MRSGTISETELQELADFVKSYKGVEDKINISRTYAGIGDSVNVPASSVYLDPSDKGSLPVNIGDDCAVIPDGHGDHLLFASEGIVNEFVEKEPWFAGYSAVMVNISDICSMGGLPVAVTDVIWTKDPKDCEELWDGMKAASSAYNVPIVGGHTCYEAKCKALSVAILGKAKKLLTSYHVDPGDLLVMAADLNGSYFGEFPFFNASTSSTGEKLREKMQLPYTLANEGLCKAAKDISMGGLLGTLAMFTSTSEKGAVVNLDNIPGPTGIDFKKWLISFPSYGYLLAIKEKDLQDVKILFEKAEISCEAIGHFRNEEGIDLKMNKETLKFI